MVLRVGLAAGSAALLSMCATLTGCTTECDCIDPATTGTTVAVDTDDSAGASPAGMPRSIGAEMAGQPSSGDDPAPMGAGTDGAAPADAPTVMLQGGSVIGSLSGATRTFLGIPYAKAPVAELRFAPPVAADPLTGPLMATGFGSSCPQAMSALSAPNPADEDCLSLNVFSPTSAESRPVMVFIHGGAFTSGGSAQYAEATTLSTAGDVVVVTINYRLGALGFLAHPALEADGIPSGNQGIRDQQLALQWVQDNIAAFGGDPANVTVFGESAGSISTCYHIFAPGSATLASRFILESGSCVSGALGTQSHAEALALGTQLTDALCTEGTSTRECLNTVDTAALLAFGADQGLFGAGWSPHIDGENGLMPDSPANLLAKGQYNKGPLVLGTNLKEWGLFTTLGDMAPTTMAEFTAAVEALVGPQGAAVAVPLYTPESDAGIADAYVDLMTDLMFRCPTRALARGAADQGSTAYLYSFEVPPGIHALELDYVFGRSSLGVLFGSNKIETLGTTIQNYWTQFASDGDPNGGDEVAWPVYTTAGDEHLQLNATVSTGSGLRTEFCDMWAQLQAAAAAAASAADGEAPEENAMAAMP